jgi:hypothetical protein
MTTRTRDPLAPLPRQWLDATLPFFRGLVGAVFVAFSSYATVFLFADDTKKLLGEQMTLGPFPDRYWYGVLLALGFFLGEIYTAERWPRAYRAILTPDTIYTARQMYAFFLSVLLILAEDMPGFLLVLALAEGGLFLVAYGAHWSLRLWLSVGLVVGGILVSIAWVWSFETARWFLAILLALYCGYIVARFGESLLFGKRRKGGPG